MRRLPHLTRLLSLSLIINRNFVINLIRDTIDLLFVCLWKFIVSVMWCDCICKGARTLWCIIASVKGELGYYHWRYMKNMDRARRVKLIKEHLETFLFLYRLHILYIINSKHTQQSNSKAQSQSYAFCKVQWVFRIFFKIIIASK